MSSSTSSPPRRGMVATAVAGLLDPSTITVVSGALIAIVIGAVDNWAFAHSFGQQVDLGLILLGLGVLTGRTLPVA